MATIVNPQESSFSSTDPDEDVAAIVKHISEHAEELYQNWKAQGLAPSEILACGSNANAVEKFGSVLTPTQQQQQQQQLHLQQQRGEQSNKTSTSSCSSSPSTPVVELLRSTSPTSLSRNNLQQFVSKFVVEDKKARQVTVPCGRQKSLPIKNYPSSIQHALQKFERNCSVREIPSSDYSISKAMKLQKKEDRIFPEHFIPTNNPPTMKKPHDDNNNNNDNKVDGNSNTWPLKVKQSDTSTSNHVNARKYATLSSKITSVNTDKFLKEVAKEEEKLMSALQSGSVIADRCVLEDNLREEVKSETETPCTIERKTSSSIVGGSRRSNTMRNIGRYSLPVENTYESSTSSSADLTASHQKFNSLLNINNSNSPSTGSRVTNNNGNPVRPFLTRGSVAERVLMFERCPVSKIEKKPKGNSQTVTSWKSFGNDVHSKIQTYSKEANQRISSTYPPNTTLQRHTKANKNVFIPRFYYPHGKPINQQQQNEILKQIGDAFHLLPNMQATKEQFGSITKACGLPLYWKAPLFLACGGEKLGYVDMHMFLDYWKELISSCHDDASKFMRIITRSATRFYVIPEDLIPLVQDVVNTHPGLTFLKQAPEFHSRYVHTVICRVYYCVNQSWSGQITLAELRKSDFLRAVQLLEEEEDINQVTAYFSYEHFYVIYCKFWELDRDHDLSIGKEDLARHSDHALSTRIIDRIFSRTRNKGRSPQCQEGRMGYTDFVIFLLAEEDKNHPRAIEYWFRCMDLDGDGYLSMYELEYFYDEQLQRMEAMGIECLPFEDCLCQMLDMIQPKIHGKISLSDLKRCKMTSIFFDTFFNLEKYLDHEQRDPFASQRDGENEMSDWERYAAEEYELLVAEEGGNGSSEDMDSYRPDLDDEEEDEAQCPDIFSCNLDEILNGPATNSASSVNNKDYRNNDNKLHKNYSHHQQRRNHHNRNGYVIENYYHPSMIVTDYSDRRCQSDSSDDYAGDSDDGSL